MAVIEYFYPASRDDSMQCGVIYVHLKNGEVVEQGPVGVSEIVGLLAEDERLSFFIDYIDIMWMVCGSPTPPDQPQPPPVVVNPPPPPPPPDWTLPPSDPPGMPTPTDGFDSTSYLLYVLEQVVVAIKGSTSTGGDKAGCGCGKDLVNIGVVIASITSAIIQLTGVLKGLTQGETDPVTCKQLTDLFAQLVAAINNLKPSEPGAPDTNVKRIADAVQGWPSDDPDVTKAIADLDTIAAQMGFWPPNQIPAPS